MSEVLANPTFAIASGFLLGFGLIAGVALSRRLVHGGDGRVQTATMGAAMAFSMIVASVLLIAYAVVAEATFIWFGLSLGGGFLVGLAVMAVWLVRTIDREERGS